MLNSILLIFGNLGTTELIIIVVIILLLFGGKKIPELMKGMVKDEIEKPLQDIDDEIDTKDSGTESNSK